MGEAQKQLPPKPMVPSPHVYTVQPRRETTKSYTFLLLFAVMRFFSMTAVRRGLRLHWSILFICTCIDLPLELGTCHSRAQGIAGHSQEQGSLLITSASLLVTSALLVVTMFAIRIKLKLAGHSLGSRHGRNSWDEPGIAGHHSSLFVSFRLGLRLRHSTGCAPRAYWWWLVG